MNFVTLKMLTADQLGYELTEHIQGEKATHMVVSKRRLESVTGVAGLSPSIYVAVRGQQ